MELGVILTLTLLLVTSSQVNAAATRPQKGAEAPNPVHGSQTAAVPIAPVSEPVQSQGNRSMADRPTTDDANSGPRTKKNDAGWQQYGTDRSEEYRKFSGVRYTPLDLAEYILRTRDEEGVALAIEELLKEGLINRDEAILYLESVKKELQTLKKRFDSEEAQNAKSTSSPHRIPQFRMQPRPTYETQRKMAEAEEKRSQVPTHQQPHPQVSVFHKQVQPQSIPIHQQQNQQPIKATNPMEVVGQRPTENQQQQLPLQLAKLVKAKAEQEKQRQPNRTTLKSTHQSAANNRTSPLVAEVDKQKQEDKPAYDDYLMENVIYQLAKDMFTQSMIRDNASAEQLLSRFASFLENELADKRFSKETQNKIMDTVSAALVESLRERLYLEN